jgi:sec-independent protein translocase protein TatA
MGGFGWPEIAIIAVIVVLIFGVGKVADVGPALGNAIKGFKEAVQDDDKEDDKEPEETAKPVEEEEA